MTAWIRRFVGALTLVVVASSPAFAQGGTTSALNGTVMDAAGGVIPGATVTVKSVEMGTTYDAVTNSSGAFAIPALNPGGYAVSVALMGFKTAQVDNVRVQPGAPTSISVTLEVGSLTETVVVESASQLINTTTATISSTLNVDQINKMPMPTRNAINAVTFLPGVNTAGANRDSNFNGLPDSFVAISLDGVNNNENYNKSTEGLFAMVTPRQDAVEAVTVTSAVGGADVGGHGAVHISFVTRSGTNTFAGSAYEYYRDPKLNTNYWFNDRNGLPKNDVRLNQFGVRQGGPIVIPGLYDGRNKAFFFFNHEELRLPNNFSRSRTVLTPLARSGVFRYTRGTQVEQIDILALAARNGHPTALDPLVQQILNYQLAAMATTGQLNQQTDPNLMAYAWQSPGKQIERQPVVRLDYNLSDRHRLTGVYNWQLVNRNPDHLNDGDANFPGAPNFSENLSHRPLVSTGLRSTISSNLVNELRGGFRWDVTHFGLERSNSVATFDDTDGLAINLSGDGLGLTDWHVENGPTARSVPTFNLDNTLNWQKDRHSISLGASVYYGGVWADSQQMVPSVTLGLNNADPAFNLFSTANFPGASTGQLTDARELYSLLVGRVSAVGGQATLNAETGQYEFLGKRRREGSMQEYSLFVQDSWRATPTLTLNGGLRWDLQLPFSPSNDIMTLSSLEDACGVSGLKADGTCRFFEPGATGGVVPQFRQFKAGTRDFKTDWNNLAPNVGVAWRPNVQNGLFRALLGDPEQATLRAGFSIAYNREGMNRYIDQYGVNPGSALPLTRSVENGLLPTGVLLSERDRLTPQSFDAAPSYPIGLRANRADDISIFHPDIEISSAQSWQVSWQRALSRSTAMELRYVGTRGRDQWSEENWNEDYNIIENGFFDEFKLAMQNLTANNAAGGSRAGSFAYFGPGSGTSPLPIYLAHLNGSRDVNNASAYSGANWTNSTLAGRLVSSRPEPYSAAADLVDNATRRAAGVRAGIAGNFFLVNPDADDVFVWVSKAYSDYHAMQLELRRRLSNGLQINGSYQYAIEGGSSFLGQRYGREMTPSANVRHAIKTQWDWSVPVGRGRRFGNNMNRVVDALVGGWEFSGAGRVQARTINFGNVRLVGMDVDELTSMFKYRFETDAQGLRRVYILPADVILNTRRAYNTSTSSLSGYSDLGVPTGQYIAPANSADCIEIRDGDCAPRALLVRAPFFSRFDIGVTKRFAIKGRTNFELRADVLNVFDAVNFTPVANPGTGASIFEVTGAYRDTSNTFDPGGRLGQLVFRLNW